MNALNTCKKAIPELTREAVSAALRALLVRHNPLLRVTKARAGRPLPPLPRDPEYHRVCAMLAARAAALFPDLTPPAQLFDVAGRPPVELRDQLMHCILEVR